MDNKNRLKGWGEHPKPQKQKLPKQYREKKLIKPVNSRNTSVSG